MLKIYCYPRCTTCQRATKYLDAKSNQKIAKLEKAIVGFKESEWERVL